MSTESEVDEMIFARPVHMEIAGHTLRFNNMYEYDAYEKGLDEMKEQCVKDYVKENYTLE